MIVGRLYVIKTSLSKPPKDKLTICICAADNFFFWINTKPRAGGVGQFQLLAADHPALHHDCFLDCSRATTFPPHELAAAQARDVITPDLAQRLCKFLADTPPATLPPRYLHLALQNLKAIC